VVAKSRHGVMSRSMRSEASSLHASEPVVSLITWRPQAWERRLSLRVDSRSQGSAVPTQGRLLYATTDWRILCRPISSIPAVRQLSAGKSVGRSASSFGSPKGGRTVENFDSNGCAHEAREAGRRRRCIASCAEQRTGEATYARGRKCENALELRGRVPAEFPGQAMHGALRAAGAREVGLCPDEIEHTGQQETALWARWGAHRERVDADA